MQSTTAESELRILHLEDSPLDHGLVKHALAKAGLAFSIERVESLEAFLKLTRSQRYDVILADYRLPGFTALDAWSLLEREGHPPPFILISGAIGEAAAVGAIKMGMSDYLLKDDLGKLGHVVRRALDVREIRIAKELAYTELAASEKRLAEFSEHLQTTIEQERAAIAREVHDDIGGALAAMKLDLAWIARHSTDPAVASHLQAAGDMLQHALGASQRIMMNLRPAILDQGLAPAVQWLASGFERRTGIKTTFHATDPQQEISKAVQLTAYRTAQEALTNISKHARCSTVLVDLTDANGVLTLEVTDNGQGIAADELGKPKSFGIKGLQERARAVGGWLDVSTGLGTGTSIILSVPLDAPADAGAEESAP
jgi:signal transduction histidine kinase